MALRYREIADDLRRRMDGGEFPPGSRLPTYDELRVHYSTGRGTIGSAVEMLEAEGRVRPLKKVGLIVLAPAESEPLTADGPLRRDQDGRLGALAWIPLAPPAIERRPASPELAAALAVSAGEPVTVIEVVLARAGQDPGGSGQVPAALETWHLPGWLAVQDQIAAARLSPELLEREFARAGHGPVSWSEQTDGRLPAPAEAKTLRISERTPLLTFRVRTASADGRPLSVCETRVSADRFHLQRDLPPRD
jgi:GntR family transcriptional regulator